MPYVKVDNNRGCCISEEFHERCVYNKSNEFKAKEFCDVDKNCKGYVGIDDYSLDAYQHWELATLSACHLGGQKLDDGKQDDLIKNGTCGFRYKGCNIKQSNFSNIQIISRISF